jgi:protease PrsW
VIARAVLVAAVPEETAKVALIALVVARLRAVHEPMNGLIYGAAVGLGFAAWENLGYLATYTADWESLAIARDVLTVPFHCALGMIAGTYLAAARFAGALGVPRRGASKRAVAILLAWFIPVILHAAFDVATLALRRKAVASAFAEHVLQACALLIGFGAMAFAASLALRLAARQKPLEHRRHAPAVLWRGLWALSIAGGAAGFAGAALPIAQVQQARLVHGIDPAASSIGVLLLVGACIIAYWSRRRLIAAYR